MRFVLGVVCVILFLNQTMLGQRVIAVQNPTFEQNQLWHSCIFAVRNSLDTLSEDTHQKTSHNIVSQAEGAFEGISQVLTASIHKGICYQFTFYARRDSDYVDNQVIMDTNHESSNPLNLFIYGADGNCGFGELITTPETIQSHQWIKYVVTLQSQRDWSHLNIYAMRADHKPYNGYVLFHQQGPLIAVFCPTVVPPVQSIIINDFAQMQPYSMLTFGGILMLYEVGPKSINLFDRKGEIVQSVLLRKDESRNYGLDSVLNKYRGINYLFLIMKNKKYRNKRLNLISYLKTKYPEILVHSKIMRYSALPTDLYHKDEKDGDLLIVENINDNIQRRM